MSVLKKYIIKAMPDFALNRVKAYKERGVVEEISKLDIQKSEIEDGYIKITLGSGRIFYGVPSSETRRTLYKNLLRYFPSNVATHLDADNFETVYEIVSRYSAPRSIPGELVRNVSDYRKIRDPLEDFDYQGSKKKEIAEIFCPKPEETFLDVGAFMGYGTMRIAEYMQDKGQIIAIEADPDIAEILRKNIKANNFDCITVVEAAVSNVPETVNFYKSSNTVNSLNVGVLKKLGHENLQTISVQTRRLDEILQSLKIKTVDKVNITINGGELKALNSMKEILTNSKTCALTLAGWYVAENGEKICNIVKGPLEEMGFDVLIGNLGRVLAVKK